MTRLPCYPESFMPAVTVAVVLVPVSFRIRTLRHSFLLSEGLCPSTMSSQHSGSSKGSHSSTSSSLSRLASRAKQGAAKLGSAIAQPFKRLKTAHKSRTSPSSGPSNAAGGPSREVIDLADSDVDDDATELSTSARSPHIWILY